MKRHEFSKGVRVAVIKRATKYNMICCEMCGALAKKWQIDHIRADGLLGEPTIENAMLICETCWRVKNPQDTSAIAKAKRREAINLGATKPKGQIKSRGFVRKERAHEGRPPVARRET